MIPAPFARILCALLIIVGAGCRGPCPGCLSPSGATEEPHGPPPCAAKSPPSEERPASLPCATPVAPAPQRVIIEVVQRTAAPATVPAPPPAAVPVALPAPAQAPALPPVLPPTWQPQPMQAVPVAPGPYTRVGLTLGWCHISLPYPRLQPVLVQPEPSIVSVPVQVQPAAVAMMPAPPMLPMPPQHFANVPVTGTALVPVPPGCAPPLSALPPAAGCAMPASAMPPAPALPPIRTETAAELTRQIDALRAAMERAAVDGAKK